MNNVYDYNILLNQAFQKIKCVRDPHSMPAMQKDARMEIIKKETAISFWDNDYDSYITTISAAKEISISCLQFMICTLFKHYGRGYEEVPIEGLSHASSKVHFAFKDLSSNTILFFKDPEDSLLWKVRGKEPSNVEAILEKYASSGCKYIYLMYDHAYTQVIGHNSDLRDPGRGYNLYSLKWFFEEYFGADEYLRFHRCFTNYVSYVKEYLGISVIKSLTPTAEANFKRIVRHSLLTTAYERILSISYEYENNNGKQARKLKREDFIIIRRQYLDESLYLSVLGNSEYAESLVTAEWLYTSMKNAKAIDLTAVAMGYFKSAEQFLTSILSLIHSNTMEWDDESDLSLGSIAHFFKDNLHLFRSNISYSSRKFIKEALFAYRNLRNGYLHKHNIHGWEQVDRIREETLNLFFLMLGGLSISSERRKALGISAANVFSDYYRLCEYIDYHAGDIFILCYENGKERVVVATPDKNQIIVDHNYFRYSGAYFRTLFPPYQQVVVGEDHKLKEIHLAEISYKNTEEIQINLTKIEKIFSDGRFLGPSIIAEKGSDF